MDFMIVGIARCGTTSLYHYLRQHPDIGLPNKKEPKYFSSKFKQFPHQGPGDPQVDEEIIKSKNEYARIFESIRDHRIIGEASSDYFYFHKKVIPELKLNYGSNLKIIICIRNPSERAYSAYSNLVRDSRETLSFKEGLLEESNRIKNNYDWMWHYKSGSLYSSGIENFQKNFQNVLVILNEDLKNNPEFTIRKVFKFLDVSNNFIPDMKIQYSPSGQPRNILIKLITSRTNNLSKLRKLVIDIIPRERLEIISKRFFNKSDIDERIALELRQFFRNDIEKTEKLIQRDLTSWK